MQYFHKDKFGQDIEIGDYIVFANDVQDWGPSLSFGIVKSCYENGIMISRGKHAHAVLFTERSTMVLPKELGVEFQLRFL